MLHAAIRYAASRHAADIISILFSPLRLLLFAIAFAAFRYAAKRKR